MNAEQRKQLENLHRHIEWLDADAYARQLAKTKDPQAVFDLIRRGDTTGFACALKNGLPPDLADRNGMTMLHHAAGHDARLIAAMLTDKANATPWARDKYGRLPLDVARECAHADMGDRLERITYPSLFLEERDGPVDREVIERYEAKRKELGSPDTRPAYAQSVGFRGAVSLSKERSRDETGRTR
tara:strand:+ start:2802 stop:3359 length:558 start_codon:yes stop_codon:yes gene_type:complete